MNQWDVLDMGVSENGAYPRGHFTRENKDNYRDNVRPPKERIAKLVIKETSMVYDTSKYMANGGYKATYDWDPHCRNLLTFIDRLLILGIL